MSEGTTSMWKRIARADAHDKLARSAFMRRTQPECSPYANIYAPWVKPEQEDYDATATGVDHFLSQ